MEIKRGHTVSVWATIVTTGAVALIGALAMIAHAGVCNEPSYDYPFFSFFCEIRRTGLSVFVVAVLMLLVVLLYASSYDRDEIDHRTESSRQAVRRFYHKPAKGARAIWRNKETPHRRKTMGAVVGILVLGATWFIVIEYAPIAFPPLFPDRQQ